MEMHMEHVGESRGQRILARQLVEMEQTPIFWEEMDELSILDESPALANEPVQVRNALAVRRMLLAMPITIGDNELVVGSFRTLRAGQPQLPEYLTDDEDERYSDVTRFGSYGHCAADYATLVHKGLRGIRAEAQEALLGLSDPQDAKAALYRSFVVVCDAVRDYALRFADLANQMAAGEQDLARSKELIRIAQLCRRVPECPATTFYEALQSITIYHTAIHNVYFDGALGRLDQVFAPLLEQDLDQGRLTEDDAQELLDCFLLKINDCAWHKSLSGDEANLGMFGSYIRRGSLHELVVGGQTSDGSLAVNRVTRMVLDASQRLSFIYPIISIRLTGDEDAVLMAQIAETLRGGGGMPVLYNDQTFVPALVRAGIPLEDARDYTNDGCWEVTVCGKTCFTYRTFSVVKALEWVLTRGVGLPIDWKRALGWKKTETYEIVPASELSVSWPTDLAPNNWPWYRMDATDGTRSIGQGFGQPIDTGPLEQFSSFEKLMEALERQLDHQVQQTMASYWRGFSRTGVAEFGVRGPTPLASVLIKDCMATGKYYGQGGERYHILGVNPNTIANATDSLCAIRKYVYEEELLSLEQLVALLERNFEGEEMLRSRLANCSPRFGNGNAEADAIASRLLNYIAGRVAHHGRQMPAPEGYNLIWGFLSATFEWAARYGSSIGATADGRRASEPVAANLGPSIGAAVQGPTAILRSHTSLPLGRLITGGALDLHMDGTTLGGDEGLKRMDGFVRSFLDLGGGIMTVTVVDADTLRRAQLEPQKYRHLRVRLGGQQAYFTGLSRDMQEWCIARVEGGLSY